MNPNQTGNKHSERTMDSKHPTDQQSQATVNLQDFYRQRSETLRQMLARRKARGRAFVAGEITTFLSGLALVVAYTVWSGWPWLVAAAVAFVLYVVVRVRDVSNSDHIRELEDLLSVNEHETAYLNGSFSCFDDGHRYADPRHPYSFDLDIFGPESLFQRLCRTVTTGGSDLLAAALSRDLSSSDGLLLEPKSGETVLDTIRRQARQVRLLASRPLWRERFIAVGQRSSVDIAAVSQALSAFDKACGVLPRWLLRGYVLWILALSVALLALLTVLSIVGFLPASIPMIWAVAQFFVSFSIGQRVMKAVGGKTDLLLKAMAPLTRLADLLLEALLDGEDPRCAMLTEARRELRLLLRLSKEMDRRGNMLGLFLGDSLFMNDILLSRRLLAWQTRNGGKSASWLRLICCYDALVSMATQAYNEPSATEATLDEADRVVFEAEDLWHPFLGDKAVRNDFSITDRNFYIITGANMAGKSTFLRSIGVNSILAMNGMPVFARRLRISRFNLFSSMRTKDDLSHGISYFNAELLRIRQLIDNCNSHSRTLIILDEILKGTNSLDKLNGSRMFLQWISQKNVTGIIATHDLELSKLESDRFHNYCFEISLGEAVTYSYKITPGVARNQNATFLLKQLLH